VTTKLNLGAGRTVIPGYQALDAKTGDKVYPLEFPDNHADEIRASHVLEHFPAAQVEAVLREWVRVLKPGGTLKIAVPDFEAIAHSYTAGEDLNVQGYVMGGQSDGLDFHKTLFDEKSLRAQFARLGLIGARPWKSEIDDCAALPISLNLAATKPGAPRPRIAAICSMPRLGFNDFWGVMLETVRPRGIEFYRSIGVFWGKKLTQGIVQILERDPPPEWILTLDYDTVFTPEQLDALIDVASRHPEADAIAPLQASRHHKHPMLTVPTEDGAQNRAAIARESLDGELLKIRTAHFGCTLIRVEKLLQLPKPWFVSRPDDDGGWGETSIDEDIWFWHQWAKAGFSLHVACRVPVGHIDIAVRWPDINLETVWQTPRDFLKGGPPNDVWR
jgi:SAM-dependent methyltransferase